MSDPSQVDLSVLDQVQEISEDHPVPCARLIGSAGTGKSYTLIKRTQEDPGYGLLTATTGIAAVNIGGITIHSTLRYSDLTSLRDAFLSGRLQRNLHPIAREYKWLIIEEYSMSDAASLDLWYRGVQETNRYADVEHPLGILLVGDLAQLPPVPPGDWCFRAQNWGQFADNTHRLSKVYRQDTGAFLDALNLSRLGKGGEAAEVLDGAGVKWHSARELEFGGTTILPKNELVNRHNQMMMDTIRKPGFKLQNVRWGMQRGEWQQNLKTKEWGIPPELELKESALVMILANAPDFRYVNGDCGTVLGYDAERRVVQVELKRTGKVEEIPQIVRSYDFGDRPDPWDGITIPSRADDGAYIDRPHYRSRVQRYVLGQIGYFPLRAAYATTVHKSQSLTLDAVQCDIRDWFFSKPAMCYVALSRCRTLTGLRIVGQKDKFIKHCNMASEVLPWL